MMVQDWFSVLKCEVRKREDDPYQMTQQGGPHSHADTK